MKNMNLLDKSHAPPSNSNFYYVGLGVLLAIGILFAVKDYRDRNNVITIHVPVVEVH